MTDRENLANLLLLGCLVGVVMFMCFAMATLNLLASIEESETPQPDPPSLITQRNDLIVQKQRLQQTNKQLTGNLDYIKGKIGQAAKQMAVLQKTQALDHSQEITKIREELNALEKEKQGLLDELHEAKQNINKVNVWKELGGTIRFKNPLFLECRGRVVMVHPGKKVLNKSDLNRRDSLRKFIQEHDGIVLLVRPDGFNTFLAAFLQARKTGQKLAYEPVDRAWQLDFSKVKQ